MEPTQAVSWLLSILSALNKARKTSAPFLSLNLSDFGLVHIKNHVAIDNVQLNLQIGPALNEPIKPASTLMRPSVERESAVQDEPLSPLTIPATVWPFETGLYLLLDSSSQGWLESTRPLMVGTRNMIIPVLANSTLVHFNEANLHKRRVGIVVRSGTPVALSLGWKDERDDGRQSLSLPGTYEWDLATDRTLQAGRSTWQLESIPTEQPVAMNNDIPTILHLRNTITHSVWRLVREHPGRPVESYWLLVARRQAVGSTAVSA